MKSRLAFWLLLSLALTPALHAAIKPHALFADHVVLQREKSVPVWGTADPSEKIAVTFPSPKAVRYGWANVPDVNLFSQAGLPASPFRTDQ